MTIVVNDASTINESKPQLVSSITIVSMMPQFGSSLTNDSRVVIYHRNMFIIQTVEIKANDGKS